MEEGVSPSLSRHGLSFSSELGFSGLLSVSVSVSVSFVGGSNFPDSIHLTSFSSTISVSSTREPVSYGKSLRVSLVGSTNLISSVVPFTKDQVRSDGSNMLHGSDPVEVEGGRSLVTIAIVGSRRRLRKVDLLVFRSADLMLSTDLHPDRSKAGSRRALYYLGHGFLMLIPQQSIKAMPSAEMPGVTTVFKPMSTPATVLMCLISVGSPISHGYGIGYVFQVVGFIGVVGSVQANGGVVPDFWNPFLVMPMMSNGSKKLFTYGSASPDPLVFVFGGRSMGFHENGIAADYGFVGLSTCVLSKYLATAALPDLARSVSEVNCLPGFVMPKSWVMVPGFQPTTSPAMGFYFELLLVQEWAFATEMSLFFSRNEVLPWSSTPVFSHTVRQYFSAGQLGFVAGNVDENDGFKGGNQYLGPTTSVHCLVSLH